MWLKINSGRWQLCGSLLWFWPVLTDFLGHSDFTSSCQDYQDNHEWTCFTLNNAYLFSGHKCHSVSWCSREIWCLNATKLLMKAVNMELYGPDNVWDVYRHRLQTKVSCFSNDASKWRGIVHVAACSSGFFASPSSGMGSALSKWSERSSDSPVHVLCPYKYCYLW